MRCCVIALGGETAPWGRQGAAMPQVQQGVSFVNNRQRGLAGVSVASFWGQLCAPWVHQSCVNASNSILGCLLELLCLPRLRLNLYSVACKCSQFALA